MKLKAVRKMNLHYVVEFFGGLEQAAERGQTSRKYLEQILTGFQGPKDKSPRGLGNAVADRFSYAIGEEGWMDRPHPELWAELDNRNGPPGPAPEIPALAGHPAHDLWVRYNRAGDATRAVVDLLLVRPKEPKAAWVQPHVEDLAKATVAAASRLLASRKGRHRSTDGA